MNIGTYLYLIILFVVFSPGIIFSIPFGSSEKLKWIRVFTHGFLFSVVWLFTHSTVNNVWKTGIVEGIITDGNSTTDYQPYPSPPPPTLDMVDTIIIKSKQPYLSIAEVQVFDDTGTNIALNKPATQSSEGWEGNPKRAVDGNTSGYWGHSSVTHTDNGDNNPWWKVELGLNHGVIKTVIIYNRTDCCNGRLDGAYAELIAGKAGNILVGRLHLNSSAKQQFSGAALTTI